MSDIKYQQKVIEAKGSIAQIMKCARVQDEDREQFINECSELSKFIDELANGVRESTTQASHIQNVNGLLFDFWKHIRGGMQDTSTEEVKQGVADFLANYNR